MYFLLINSGCFLLSFPGSSTGKKSTCNAGDPSSIPGLGRSTREGIGYPLQYSWAFLVAQLVKNPPQSGFNWVQSLGGKMPWRREWLPTLAFLPGEFHVLYSPWGLKELDTTERLSLSLLLSATFSWSNWKQDLLELFIWFSRRSS